MPGDVYAFSLFLESCEVVVKYKTAPQADIPDR